MTVELLREAAKVLREHAEAATPGPWQYVSRNWIATGPIEITEADWGPDGHDRMQVCTNEGPGAWRVEDVQYIALMHPPVALALADLLEDCAVAAENWPAPGETPDIAASAEALARAILRRPS